MGAEVVGASEAFGAEGALEGSRVFLDPFTIIARSRGACWVGKVEDVVTIRD